MTALATTRPATPSTRRGFSSLRCPLCGTADETQCLDLDDLQTLHCAGCGEDYTLDDVRELIAAWQRLLAWIDAAPAKGE